MHHQSGYTKPMGNVAVHWDMDGRDCLVVGAGRTGQRRAAALSAAGARVTVIAPDADEVDFPRGCVIERRAAVRGDLQGRKLVVLATDDPELQQRMAKQAVELGILINRADEGESSDINFLATRRKGLLSIAVSTDGASAAAAALIAEQALAAVADTWEPLLEQVAQERVAVQKALPAGEARERLLRQLVDERSRAAAVAGENELRAHWDALRQQALKDLDQKAVS